MVKSAGATQPEPEGKQTPTRVGAGVRWAEVRTAYRTQVARRADIDNHVAKFVPAFASTGGLTSDGFTTGNGAEFGRVTVTPEGTYPAAAASEVSVTANRLETPANGLGTPPNRLGVPANSLQPTASPGGSVPHWLKVLSGWGWRLIIVAASIWLLVFLVGRLRMVFISLFIALVLTSVLRPLRSFYDRFMKRGLAVLCSLITALLAVVALVTYVVASVAHSWSSVGAQFSTGVQKLIDLLRGPPLRLQIPYEHVGDAVTAGQGWLADHYGDVAGRVMASAGTAFEMIATIALSIFLTAFFLSSGRKMWHWLLAQFPQRVQHKLSVAFGTGFVTFAGYARGEVLISTIDGILAAILLTVLRIPLAIPLAVLVFIGAFIPMIGAPAAMVIAGVVALAADGPVKALVVILGVALIGQIEGHLLQPFLMGHQVNLHPVVIALAVASGTLLGGVMGAILAVPLVAVVWRVYQKLRPNAPDGGAAVGLPA